MNLPTRPQQTEAEYATHLEVSSLLSLSESPAFFFADAHRTLYASGRIEHFSVPALEREALLDSVSNAGEGGGWLLGALPFERTRESHLFVPEGLRVLPPWRPMPPDLRVFSRSTRRRAVPPSSAYEALVSSAQQQLLQTDLRKVVLAREHQFSLRQRPGLASLMTRLRAAHHTGASFAMALPVSTEDALKNAVLVGASPELLVSKSGSLVECLPLAGSRPRGRRSIEDAELRRELLESAKDHDEHRLLIEQLVCDLSPWVEEIQVPERPIAVSTPTMWHLATPLTAKVRDPEVNVLRLVLAVHPSAAVCGVPRERANQTITALEPMSRGFFGGAIGYMDPAGDGHWAVTIRCAELSGDHVRLLAGAGIVAASDPKSEAQETQHKMSSMLNALESAREDGEMRDAR